MMTLRTVISLVAVTLMTAAAIPCDAAGNSSAEAHRRRLTLSEAPLNPQQVLTVFKRLTADKERADLPAAREVVVVGSVGGMPNIWPDTHPHFPWYPGQASFFLVDSRIARHMATHAKHHGGHDDCVFCRQLAAKNVHAIAVVNLVDEHGKTLPIDLRQVFDLKEGQTVIIRGKAKLLAGSLLQIDADGIYAKRQTAVARSAGRPTK
jgi:hypothetical protein